MTNLWVSVASALIGTAANIAVAQSLARVGDRTPLLGGRLTIELPEGAIVKGRTAPLMGAPAPDEDETRVILDAGTERFVLLATETFQTDVPEIDQELAARVTGQSLDEIRVYPATTNGDIRTVRVTPGKTTSDRDAKLIAIYLSSPGDHVVAKLAFFVNPDGARRSDHYAALAEKMVQTVRSGNRRLDTAAGARRLGDLVATVPEGYVMSEQSGPDFLVYSLRRVAPLGRPGPLLGVYLGNYPSSALGEGKRLPSVRAKLFGLERKWEVGSEAEAGAPTRRVMETIQDVPGKHDEKAQVWLVADDDDQLRELKAIAKSLEPAPWQ